jgi:hypothetical protein
VGLGGKVAVGLPACLEGPLPAGCQQPGSRGDLPVSVAIECILWLLLSTPLPSLPFLPSRGRYQPDCCLEFPRGGSQAMVDALVRGLEKHGGRLLLRSHVDEITTEGGKATGGGPGQCGVVCMECSALCVVCGEYAGQTGCSRLPNACIERPSYSLLFGAAGVRLRGGRTIRAARAVVSNASSPDTLRLLPAEAVPASWRQSVQDTPLNPSFMHLHLGFDATGARCQCPGQPQHPAGKEPASGGQHVPLSTCEHPNISRVERVIQMASSIREV